LVGENNEQDGVFQTQFGVALAENTEAAILAIISDLETGAFEKWTDVEEYVEYQQRAGFIYSALKDQMRDVDAKRIMIGESPIFSLPLFGV
jgi:hypothetical protein